MNCETDDGENSRRGFKPSLIDWMTHFDVFPKAAIAALAAKGRIVRISPVRTRCSERQFILDPPFVDHVAKVS